MKNKEKTFQTYELELTKPEGDERAWHGSELANHSLGLTQRKGSVRGGGRVQAGSFPGAAQTKLTKLHVEQSERGGRKKGEMLIEVTGLGVTPPLWRLLSSALRPVREDRGGPAVALLWLCPLHGVRSQWSPGDVPAQNPSCLILDQATCDSCPSIL